MWKRLPHRELLKVCQELILRITPITSQGQEAEHGEEQGPRQDEEDTQEGEAQFQRKCLIYL